MRLLNIRHYAGSMTILLCAFAFSVNPFPCDGLLQGDPGSGLVSIDQENMVLGLEASAIFVVPRELNIGYETYIITPPATFDIAFSHTGSEYGLFPYSYTCGNCSHPELNRSNFTYPGSLHNSGDVQSILDGDWGCLTCSDSLSGVFGSRFDTQITMDYCDMDPRYGGSTLYLIPEGEYSSLSGSI